MVADSFKPGFQPGDYACEWIVGDRRIAGQISLEALRPPQASLFGDVEERDWSKGVDLPQNHDYDRVVGRIRSGQDVVLTDTRITDLDLLFGVAPISSVTSPPHDAPHIGGQFAVKTNPLADRRWEDEQDGLIVDCTYDIQSSMNAHRHTVLFSPVVELASHTSLTVDEWMDRWVRPMLRIAALATRRPQRLTWLTVSTAPVDATGREWPPHTNGVVFGSGIEQAPYEADYPDEWRRPENRPLFTLESMPMTLPELLRRWVDLSSDGNLFLELYGLALRQADLPPRARFLYLVQALEALHAEEHAAEELAAQEEFAAQRNDVITALKGVGLPSSTLSFIRGNWSKTKMPSLDRRLRQLIDMLPVEVQNALVPPPGNVVAAELSAAGNTKLEGQVRGLRNDLSHGRRNFADRALLPWVGIVETLCRAHALRLLGFEDGGIADGLVAPAAPDLPA